MTLDGGRTFKTNTTTMPGLYDLLHLPNFPLYNHFSDQALITLKYFFPKSVQFYGEKLSGLSERLSFNPQLFFFGGGGVKNVKNLIF